MEKQLTKREFLLNLLKTATNPFCSDEKLNDIQQVLTTSSNFDGLNHLLLVQDYLKDEDHIFYITKEEAILQAEAAINEGNIIGNYYLYLLYLKEKPKLAISYLEKVVNSCYPKADLKYANHLLYGDIIDKDENKALKYFKIASQYNLSDGYYGMLYIYEKQGKILEAFQVYNEAKSKNIELPGVVR